MKKQISYFIFFIALNIFFSQSNSYAWPIPHSGVTTCYDNEKEIPCPKPGEPFYGQSGNYIINPKSYTKLDEKGNDLPDDAEEWFMVRDNVTGLIWEVKQAKDYTPDYNNPHDADNEYTWYDSNPETNYGYTGTFNDGKNTESYIQFINESNFGGFGDWRLPSIKELASLASLDKWGPAIDEMYFRENMSAFYWSSTSRADYTVNAWGVNFLYGYVYNNPKVFSYYVRAVRGGQCRSFDHWVIGHDKTVTDTKTGLIWAIETSESRMNWEDALNYCETNSLAGYSDWRLPEKEELRSIVDYTRYSPTIDTNYFKTMSAFYWSSTSYAYNTGHAWGVHFDHGYASTHAKDSSYYVRAVRGGQCRSFGHLVIWSPMQAAILITGTTIPISWDTANIEGNVKITLSRQGGKADTFETITSETQNDGHYDWTITGSPSPNCMLTIEPVSFPYSGTQQSFFTIKNPDIRVNPNVQTSFSISGPEIFTATGTSWTTDNALPGDYTITYSPLACWQSPAQESQSLTYWATLTFQGMYTPSPPLPVQNLQAELPVETWSATNQISVEWDTLNECTQGFAYVWDNQSTTEPPQTITTKANQIVSPKLSYGNNHWFHIRTIDIHGNASETMHLGPFYIKDSQVDLHALNLLLPKTAIENINGTSVSGKVLIPSAHEEDTVINLSANSTDIRFPQTVIIPGHHTEASFTLQPIDNERWGSQKVSLTASASGYTSTSAEIIIIDDDIPTQSPETIYAFSDGNHRIKLLWPLQSMSELDPLSFQIYRSDSENGFYYQVNRFPIVKTQIFENKPVYEFTDTDLQYQTTYWYKIKTIRSNYFESDFSLPVSIVPKPHPDTGDFRLDILDPVQYVGPNQNAIFNISIMSEDYFDEIVNLSATCNRLNPQYLTFSRQSIPPETSTQLIVSLPFNIDSGEYTIQVAGISTCCSHLSTITLKVVVPGTGESAIAINASSDTVGLNDTLFLKGNIIPYIPSDTPYFIHIKPPESNHWNKYPGILQTNSLFTFNKYQPDQQGEYLIKASWDGNDYYRGSESNETVLIVGKGKSQLLCSTRNEDISPGSLFYLTVELYPQLSGQPITIQVIKPDESTETAGFQLTNEDGMVSLTYLLNEQTGIWKFTAYWPGNETYVGTQSHPFVIYPGIETGQAIIVAGGGMTDHLWEFSEFFTKEFYLFLKKKRFSHDQIMYFSDNSNDYDDNGDGIYEIFVDNHEPLANDVLTYIAGLTSSEVSEKKPLILYMHAHGSEDKFLVNTYSDFSATQLDDALDDLQEDTNCTVALILDACKSGAFIEKLTPEGNQKRILISSAENTVARNIVDSDHEYWSFSNFLMDALSIKSDLESGFLLAAHKMSGRHEFNTQTPVIIKGDDTVFKSPFYIGGLSVTEAALPPEILSTTPNQVITQGRFNLFAHVYSLENIQSVKASIMPPFLIEQIHNYRPDAPIQNLESIALYDMDHDNTYEGEYNFVYQGTYSITFFARDVDNNVDQKTILLTLENGKSYSYLNDVITVLKLIAGMPVDTDDTLLYYYGCVFDLGDAIYWMKEVL